MRLIRFKRTLHKLFPEMCVWDGNRNDYAYNDDLKNYLRNNMRKFESPVTKCLVGRMDSGVDYRFNARRDTIEYIKNNMDKVLFDLL